jgi:hypothetical protein
MHQTIDHVLQLLQAASSSIIGGARLRVFLRDDIAVLAIGRVSSFATSTTWLLSVTFQFSIATCRARKRTAVALRDAIIVVIGGGEDGCECR